MKQCFFLMCFLTLLSSLPLTAQQKEFIFKNFTQEEGLPSNETYCIFEDSRHYLWIATDLGVVRYNGNKFEQFQLPDNVVFKIKEDSRGRIWFFSHKAQLAYFENEKIRAYRYNDSIAEKIANIHITGAHIDSSDNITLNSANGTNYYISNNGSIHKTRYETASSNEYHVYFFDENAPFTQRTGRKIDSGLTKIVLHNPDGEKSLYAKTINAPPFNHYGCVRTSEGSLYFFAGKNLIKIKNNTCSVKTMPKDILSVIEIRGRLWLCMVKGGAVMLSPDLDQQQNISSLKDKTVTSATVDYEGGIWLSTLENGIFYIKNPNIFNLAGSDLLATNTYRTFNSMDSLLIVGNQNGVYSLHDLTLKRIIDLPNNNISSLVGIDHHTLLISGDIPTKNDFHLIKTNNPVYSNAIITNAATEVIRIDRENFLINRLQMLYLSKLSKDNVFASPYRSLEWKLTKPFLDKDKNIWLGTIDGLYRMNKQYDSIIAIKPGVANLKTGVNCIRQVSNDIIVVGTRSHGIVLMKDTTVIDYVTEKEGLLSDKIKYLLAVKNTVWIATAKGISVIKFRSYQPLRYVITNIGKNDGFYNLTINHLEEYKGNIVASTNNGLYFLEDPDFYTEREFAPIPFFVNSVNFYRGDTIGINSITLPYSNNRVAIRYSAVSFNSHETVKYLYRFDQDDTVWHSTANNELLLENLRSGTYLLEIKAVIPQQDRSSALQHLTITVEKPWWQNNWLRLLALLLLSAVGYAYITNRIKKIKTAEKGKTELNRKLAELEQTALRSQMNPHFIFNCLTSIQQLIVSGDKTDANEYLVKFARLIRKTLELSGHPFISVKEEQEYLAEYLFLEQLRLAGQFEFRITTGSEIKTTEVYIPNMMIQPVVENCVRHGIKSLEQRKGLIQIHFALHHPYITCTVTDNGVGRGGQSSSTGNAFTKHKSFGVDITRKRLEAFSEFNQQHTGIEIKDLVNEDGSPAGTQVILQLPFKTSI